MLAYGKVTHDIRRPDLAHDMLVYEEVAHDMLASEEVAHDMLASGKVTQEDVPPTCWPPRRGPRHDGV